MKRSIVGKNLVNDRSFTIPKNPTVIAEFQADDDRQGDSVVTDKDIIHELEKKSQDKQDDYYAKLVKLIPGESVAMFLTVNSIIVSSKIPNAVFFQWALYFLGSLGTYLFLKNVTLVKSEIQLSLSVTAFLIWGYSIGGPFVHYGWYNQAYSAILIPIITFFAPIINFPNKN